MLEINELKQVKENQGEVQQRAKERAETVLQKYQKVTTILQNVLRVCGLYTYSNLIYLAVCLETLHFEPICHKNLTFRESYWPVKSTGGMILN